MTKAQTLGITAFPYREYDTNGNATYTEFSDGDWVKREFDSKGNKIYIENSDGYWEKQKFDTNNNLIYFDSSNNQTKTYTKDDLLTIMNLGMELRQNQLNGSDLRSGNEVLEDWISENK